MRALRQPLEQGAQLAEVLVVLVGDRRDLIGERADGVGDDGEAVAGGTRAGRLDAGVERDQTRFEGDRLDGRTVLLNLLDGLAHAVYGARRAEDAIGERFHLAGRARQGLGDDLGALAQDHAGRLGRLPRLVHGGLEFGVAAFCHPGCRDDGAQARDLLGAELDEIVHDARDLGDLEPDVADPLANVAVAGGPAVAGMALRLGAR